MKMNNKNIGIIAAVAIGIVVILGGGIYIFNQNAQKQEAEKMAVEKAAMMKKEDANSDSMTKDDQAMMQKDDSMMTEEDKMMMDKSRYFEYSKENLENASNEKRLLFFYASWCPICRPIDTALKNNTDLIPDGVSIIRVNFNDPDTDQEEKDLAKKYGVTYQHTFVQIDENENQINKWSSGDIKEILSSLK